jgi:hypothetical protein
MRFLSEDPLRQGPNFYSYAGHDPINRIDPLGLLSPLPERQPPIPIPPAEWQPPIPTPPTEWQPPILPPPGLDLLPDRPVPEAGRDGKERGGIKPGVLRREDTAKGKGPRTRRPPKSLGEADSIRDRIIKKGWEPGEID